MSRLLLVSLLLTISAFADEKFYPEQLAREQIMLADKAARAKLPPVDSTAAKICSDKYNAALAAGEAKLTAATLASLASCFRAAGSLGLAIRLWEQLDRDKFGSSPERVEALRQLGPAYEAAGGFSRAAQIDLRYAALFAGNKDAPTSVMRALCIYRQLGIVDEARRAESQLQLFRRRFDVAKTCAAAPPIPRPDP